MAAITAQQKHIVEHCRNQQWDSTKTVDENVSLFNMECLTGMIETGEIKFSDLEAVGGIPLVAAVAKLVDHSYIGMAK